jgi:uncharacterized damage-inducible protein DinB
MYYRRGTSTLLLSALSTIMARDIRALRREVEAYPDERMLWAQVPGLPNSAGTLVLHLAGNLQHYFGAVLNGTGYVRDRPAEFARRDVSRSALLDELDAAAQAVRDTLLTLDEEAANREYPEEVAGIRPVTGSFLVHLAIHLGYHLGQIDYHRRLVADDSRGVDVLKVAELAGARRGDGK